MACRLHLLLFHNLFSDAASEMLNALNWKIGTPFDNLRPAMLSRRSKFSQNSVNYINSLNDSYKFGRHFSGMKSQHMIRQVLAELSEHGQLLQSGLATLPPQADKKAFPFVPPGIFVLPVDRDYIDPEVVRWHESDQGVPLECSSAPSTPTPPKMARKHLCNRDVSSSDLGDDAQIGQDKVMAPSLPVIPVFPLGPLGKKVVCDYRKYSSKVCICDEARFFCRKHSKYPVCATCGNDLCDAFDGNDMCLRCPFHPSATSCSADAFNEKSKASSSFSLPKASSDLNADSAPLSASADFSCSPGPSGLRTMLCTPQPTLTTKTTIAREFDPSKFVFDPCDPRRPENGHRLDCSCASCSSIEDAIQWSR